MTKKTRLIILLCCVAVFMLVVPYMVLYSLGYRIDFAQKSLVTTGGIYVKAFPDGANISIDDKESNTTSFFSNFVFVQNLLPSQHSVSIKKEGYYDYQKTLPVVGNQVTKLEHVSLVKKDIPFSILASSASDFYITNDGKQALLVQKTGKTLSFETLNLATGQIQPLVPSINASAITGLAWSADSSSALINASGNYYILQPFLAKPALTGPILALAGAKEAYFAPQTPGQFFYLKNNNLYITGKTLPLIKNIATARVQDSAITYLSYDGSLYTADLAAASPVKLPPAPLALGSLENSKISPDGEKTLYYDNHQISYAFKGKIIPLVASQETIKNVYWLNSDYIIFTSDTSIVISEIDVRGNVNMVSVPVALAGGSPATLDPSHVFFNQQDKKLYFLAGDNFISSDRLAP